MAEAYEIVNQVQRRFKNIAEKVAKLIGKHPETISSHGREPKTINPLSSGNASPATHFMQYARQYEAGEKGAGLMLSRRVAEELELEFTETCGALAQNELHTGVLKESFDVLKLLNDCNFQDLSLPQLAAIEEEGAQLRDIASDFVAHVRAVRIKRKAAGR